MPQPYATESWSDYNLVPGKSAQRTWFVTGVLNALQAISTVPVAEQTTHPLDARLVIPIGGLSAAYEGGPASYKVVASYINLNTVVTQGSDIDAAPIIFPQIIESSEPVDRDYAGAPITNSAGQPFGSNVTRTIQSLQITITRNEATYDVARALAFGGKLNDATVFICGLRFEKYQLLCRSIGLAQGLPIPVAGTAVRPYPKVVYTLEARDYYRHADNNQVVTDGSGFPMSGWAKRILDVGREGFYTAPNSGGIQRGDIIRKKDCKPVTKDEKLNGSGRPIETDLFTVHARNAAVANRFPPDSVGREHYDAQGEFAGAHFLLFDVYSTISFNGLALPQ